MLIFILISRSIILGLYCAAKSLRNTERLEESMKSSFEILLSMGEELPRGIRDATLTEDIHSMNNILQTMTDDAIFNIKESTSKKIDILQKIYDNLVNIFHFIRPHLIAGTSLRMVRISLESGLSANSPSAFAYYGEMLIASGHLSEGCRAGKLFNMYVPNDSTHSR